MLRDYAPPRWRWRGRVQSEALVSLVEQRALGTGTSSTGGVTVSEKEKLVGIMKATANHAFLATCAGDRPVVRSVSPIVEDDLSIWLTTFSNANKVKQIQRNPRVCLAFASQPSGDKRVTVHGRAQVVSDPATKKRVWGLATFNLAEFFSCGPESEEYGVLRIIPDEIQWHESWEAGWKVYKPRGRVPP